MELRTKISGLITSEEGKVLLFRTKGKDIWTCPGGKIENNESDLECLKRELKEEACIEVEEADFLLETPIEPAAGNPGKFVIMRFYIVKKYTGTPQLNPEDNVGEMKWISKKEFQEDVKRDKKYAIGSGLEFYGLPKLIELGLLY